ncbi:RHS repeat domain-containing protein [Apibacter adventoris]|uniref:RHS repeat domain-containing protein n=1 Tax=Apibacter adventoris TaxID=1679466 RepID=UPI0026A42002
MLIEERNQSWKTPYLFNGKELDEETGLYYYGARYYNPRESVWLSTDPLSGYNPIMETEHYIDGQHNGGVFNSRNLNTYGYCYQSPVVLIDPNGKQSNFLKGMKDAIVGYATNTWERIKDWPASVGLQGNEKAVEVYTKRTEQLLETTDKMGKAISDPGAAIDKITSDSYIQGEITGTIIVVGASVIVTKRISGAIFKGSLIKNMCKFIASAKAPSKNGLSVVGQALQKHAGREGSSFSNIKFLEKTADKVGMNVLNEVLDSKNKIVEELNNGTKNNLIKILVVE